MNIVKGREVGVSSVVDYRRVYRLTIRGVIMKGRTKKGKAKWEKRHSFVDHMMSERSANAYLSMLVMLGVMDEGGEVSKKVAPVPPVGHMIIDKVEVTYYDGNGKAYDCSIRGGAQECRFSFKRGVEGVCRDEFNDAGGTRAFQGVLSEMMQRAVALGASDIHIESRQMAIVRMRVGGVIRRELDWPRYYADGVAQMVFGSGAAFDSSHPASATIAMDLYGKEYNLRLNLLPEQFGGYDMIIRVMGLDKGLSWVL